MKVMIETGRTNVNRPRHDGITPVLIAAEKNASVELMNMMLDAGGDIRKCRRVRSCMITMIW